MQELDKQLEDDNEVAALEGQISDLDYKIDKLYEEMEKIEEEIKAYELQRRKTYVDDLI